MPWLPSQRWRRQRRLLGRPNVCAEGVNENETIQDDEDPTITWICLCIEFPTRVFKMCKWFQQGDGDTAAYHRQYRDNPTLPAIGSSVWTYSFGGGFADSVIQAYEDRPAGNLAVALQVDHWNGSAWVPCRSTGFYYSGGTTSAMGVGWNFGSSPPCGTGYYGTWANTYAYDGGWRGGWNWSGYRFTGGAGMVAVPAPPVPDTKPAKRVPPKQGARAHQSNPAVPGVKTHN